jgi:hypothetical protein
MKCLVFHLVLANLLATFSSSNAQIIDVNFNGGGSKRYSSWSNLTSGNYSGYGSFPGNSPWPTPIIATAGSTNGRLNRVAGSPTGGGPFLSSSSIYFGNFAQVPNALGGTLQISNIAPLSDLRTLVFQIQIGEATGFDFFTPTGFPTLSINGGSNSVSLFTNLVTRFQSGTFPSPETGKDEPVYVNTWAFQWNLTNPLTVNSYAVNFSAVTHAQVYALRTDETSVLQPTAVVVPEPSIAHLLTLTLGSWLLWSFVRRKIWTR